MESEYGVTSYVAGDPCYGSCDTFPENDSELLGVDLVFHIGHAISLPRLGSRTIFVDVEDDVPFDEVVDKSGEMLRDIRKIGLITISQHLHMLAAVSKLYEQMGFQVSIGEGKGHLKDGQVFGCEFYPAFNIRDAVDAFVFLGQSPFHAVGVAISTGKPTFMLDPYRSVVEDMTALCQEMMKKRYLALALAKEAHRFGMIVGLREGQVSVRRIRELKRGFEAKGRSVQMITMRDITNDHLQQFRGIDAFIQSACPRISVDGYTFDRPVLSVPEAQALLSMIDGNDPGEFLSKSHWL
jgi:2-(3-amino-3-carboxypropyl)histidine synthase